MKADKDRKGKVLWQFQRQKLKQDGSMLRFKLGTNTGEPPSSKVVGEGALRSQDPPVLGSLTSFGKLEGTRLCHFERGLDDERALRRRISKPPSLVDTHLGGLRGDPFDTFPIPNRGYVPSAFDYFAQIWYPLSIHTPESQTPGGRSQLSRIYFCTVLEDEMFFEQVIAFSLVMQMVNQDCKDRLSKAVVYHTNNVMARLRMRIAENQGIDDAAILTMISLAAVSMIANDFKSFAIHVEAIRHVVSLCGGYDNLGLGGYIKANALAVVGIHEARKQTLQQQRHHGTQRASSSHVRLKYPYPPDVCEKMSKLPDGFRELALSTKLSLQHIDVLHIFMGWVQRKDEIRSSPALLMNAIIALPDSTQTARLLGQTMLAYVSYVTSLEDVISPSEMYLARQNVQMITARLRSGRAIDIWDQDFVTWACLILQRTTDVETDSWNWANEKLSVIQVPEGKLEKLEAMFLPIPELIWSI